MTSKSLPLKGKNALVTGSTSGIGLAIATELAYAGCNVMLNGFGDAEVIEKERTDLAHSAGVKVAYCGADLSSADGAKELVEKTLSTLGQIDVLVNNAGIQHTSRIEDFPPEKWDAILAINLSAAFHTTRFAVADMYKQKWGRIINIASTHGLVASPEKSAYVAAKHGIVGLTKVTALEAAESPVTCNAICPGYVHTPLVEKQIVAKAKEWGLTRDEAEKKFLAEKHPTLRFTQPRDVGQTVVFLCSPAAQNITGTTLALDGGWTAR